jgi:hypothetical protein
VNRDAAADPAHEAPSDPLPDLPEHLLAGYLDAALETLRGADQGELPGALRQYRTWTPRRLRHPRVLGLVRRTLDLDRSFRVAVDKRVLDEEDALARLLRAGRHAEALASGEAPEVVARVGVALGADGVEAVRAAVEADAASQARAEAAAVRSALAGAESELDAARARADAEAAAARAAREELRGAREELRRYERDRRALADRVSGLERELVRSEAAVRAARDEAAAEQRRLGGRVNELQARLAEAQRKYRALRRSTGQVDPVVAEAVGALERDLGALRRAAGLVPEVIRPVNLLGGLAWWAAVRVGRQARPTPALVRLYDRLVVPAERLLERRVRPRFGQSILCVARVPPPTAGA